MGALCLGGMAFLNWIMRITFSRTSAFDLIATGVTLRLFETMLKELNSHAVQLRDSFDIEFFISACRVILDTEHHQLISRLINILYTYSHMFEGRCRKLLFSDFLIRENFFKLFLHWDENTRQAFYQLLLYKAVRIKWSELLADGFEVSRIPDSNSTVEILKVIRNGTAPGFEQTSARRRGPVGASVLVDKEQYNCDMYEFANFAIFFLTGVCSVAFAQMQNCLRAMQDQITRRAQSSAAADDVYPRTLEVYVPLALSEYRQYLNRYKDWERRDDPPPGLVQLSVLGPGSNVG